MTTPDDVDQEALESIADAALDRFITTFNSRDAAAWAASLSYPHIRVSPHPGAATSSATEQHYADGVSYDAADAMGWHHSAWDSKDVLAVSQSKIHASAQWCRYDAAGERILPNNVSYVITLVDGRWGVQARFGVDSRPPADADAAASRAKATWSAWWHALGGGAPIRGAGLVQVPFHLVGTGEITEPTTVGDVVTTLGPLAESTTPGDAAALQIGQRGVNLGVTLSRDDGSALHGLFLVTLGREGAAVTAASLLEVDG